MKDITQYYSPADVSKIIDLSTSSVRRYSIALEEGGYTQIKRNDKGHRRYTMTDVRIVQYLHTLINDKKVPFNEAVKKTIADQSYIVNDVDTTVLEDINEVATDLKLKSLEQKIDVLTETMNTLVSQNRSLLEALEKMTEENKRLITELDKRSLSLDNKGVDDVQTVEDTEVINGVKEQEDEQITLDEMNKIIVNAIKSNENNETKSDKDAVNSADHTSDVDDESIEETPIKIMAVEDKKEDSRIEKMRKESEQSNQKGIGKLFSRLLGRK